MKKKSRLRFPVINHGAELLVQGLLMRRNILAYKAPQNHEGYDLVCIHPNPRKKTRQLRIQVKSRSRIGAKGFPLSKKGLRSFDYLVFVCMNVGRVKTHRSGRRSFRDPQSVEIYVLPPAVVKRHHQDRKTWSKVVFSNDQFERIAKYRGDLGIELIAKDLNIPYPRGEI